MLIFRVVQWQLVLEWGIGVEVLIRCFIDKGGTERQIVEKLGNSFSRAPYAAVVVCLKPSKLNRYG